MDSVARIVIGLDHLSLGAPAKLVGAAHFCSGL